MSCIFCKIVNGEVPDYKLYEDDEFIVILDRFPSAPGHTLIIPKEHADDIFGLDAAKAGRAFALAGAIAKKIRAALGCEGVNILQNNGEAAGQTVPHFHVHVIPRYSGDSVSVKWKTLDLSDEDMEQMLRRLA